MASTFKFHSQVGEVVPFNAQYTFPNQATKINKQIVKLPAKNGSDFKEGSTIRIEFPADDYLNVTNSYLTFDAEFTPGSGNSRTQWQRGGAQNAIKRLRILYGSLVLEDIQEYKTLVRIFSEAAIPQDYRESSGAILDGMSTNMNNEPGATAYYGAGYSKREDIQGLAVGGNTNTITIQSSGSVGGSDSYNNATIIVEHKNYNTIYSNELLAPVKYPVYSIRREKRRIIKSVGTTLTVDVPWTQIPYDFPSGPGQSDTQYFISFDTEPVIPESVVAGDITLGGPEYGGAQRRTYCLNLMSGLLTQQKLIPLKWMAAQLALEITVAPVGEACLFDGSTSLKLYDPMFVAELLNFDSTYDVAFYAGLQSSGVALKFSSWHYHSSNISGTSNTVQIHERSRSIKSAFAVVRDSDSRGGDRDTDKFFHATGQKYIGGAIDGSTRTDGAITEFQWRVGGRYYPAQPVRCTLGAAEAYVELMKAVNRFSDYTTANSINIYSWSTHGAGCSYGDKFIMASEFENSDVMQGAIAGINGEEQSDLALTFKTSSAVGGSGSDAAKRTLDVFVHYDSMIVVRGANVVDLIM